MRKMLKIERVSFSYEGAASSTARDGKRQQVRRRCTPHTRSMSAGGAAHRHQQPNRHMAAVGSGCPAVAWDCWFAAGTTPAGHWRMLLHPFHAVTDGAKTASSVGNRTAKARGSAFRRSCWQSVAYTWARSANVVGMGVGFVVSLSAAAARRLRAGIGVELPGTSDGGHIRVRLIDTAVGRPRQIWPAWLAVCSSAQAANYRRAIAEERTPSRRPVSAWRQKASV